KAQKLLFRGGGTSSPARSSTARLPYRVPGRHHSLRPPEAFADLPSLPIAHRLVPTTLAGSPEREPVHTQRRPRHVAAGTGVFSLSVHTTWQSDNPAAQPARTSPAIRDTDPVCVTPRSDCTSPTRTGDLFPSFAYML